MCRDRCRAARGDQRDAARVLRCRRRVRTRMQAVFEGGYGDSARVRDSAVIPHTQGPRYDARSRSTADFLSPAEASLFQQHRGDHSSRTAHARPERLERHLRASARRFQITYGRPLNRTGWRDPRA